MESLTAIPSALRKVILNVEFYGETIQVIDELEKCVNWERLDKTLEEHRHLKALVVRFVDVTRVRIRLEGDELERATHLFGSYLRRTTTREILRYQVEDG